jgi:periplasmic protein TonB
MPRIVKEEHPRYTVDAMRARIEGSVLLEAVVPTEGTVGEVRVMRSLNRQFGQDDEAVASVKKWKFTAGTKDGVAVPVLVEIELTFSLKK